MAYDVLIAGAGPAGATAAALLAKDGHRVLLLEKDALPRPPGQTVWVNSAVADLVETLGLDSGAVLASPFTEVTIYDGDLSRSATPKLPPPAGYLLERSGFEDCLVQAATEAGAELVTGADVCRIKLLEDGVELTAQNDQAFAGRMLVVALGKASPLLEQVLPAERMHSGQRHTAQVSGPDTQAKKNVKAVNVVLGLDREGGCGLVIHHAQQVSVSVTATASAQHVRRMLVGLCGNLVAKGIIASDLTRQAETADVCQQCANPALEMDSHVGKHCLVVGDTGGFVAAGSDEGIYPAMWSAQIAARVVGEAMSGPHTQDVLMQFDAQWRMAMADYLRPPNTDVQFLLPLIFSNPPMADRMAAAFFRGENL